MYSCIILFFYELYKFFVIFNQDQKHVVLKKLKIGGLFKKNGVLMDFDRFLS